MGSSNSSRRGSRMSDQETGESASNSRQQNGNTSQRNDDPEHDPDLATILSFLIRSGQVRILGTRAFDEGLSSDEDDEDFIRPAAKPPCDPHPDTSAIDRSEFKAEIERRLGRTPGVTNGHNWSLPQMVRRREIGMNGRQKFSTGVCCTVGSHFLPNSVEYVATYHHKAFCGIYSSDGNVFLSACQDQNIRLYDTRGDRFKEFKTIRARDVGWSILDTAFSPDGNYMIYSSWSDCIHLCSIYGDSDTHESLHLFPGDHSFAIFSLTFSLDNREILGGANDGCLYVYDRERNERTLRIDSHEDDINAVAFADASSNILFSGGDDGLCKVWDRRTLNEDNPEPVGVLSGHYDGITFIDSKNDGRYLLSNCKDQTIKLWDMRKFSPREGLDATRREVSKQHWDYRWQQVPRKMSRKKKLAGDTSLMTYRGHSVLHTLVRCRFSPQFTTGQRYIYTGCATGAVIIYDVLTGKMVTKLEGHRACVRDVSWHPYEHKIVSSSWDSGVGLWYYKAKSAREPDSDEEMMDLEGDDDDDCPGLRRSRRLKDQRRSRGHRSEQLFSLWT